MDDAWWGPSIPLPSGPYFCLAERSLPGCLLVNGAGQRFVNESAPYVDAVHAMYEGHTGAVPHIPSWLIFDQRYRNSYVFAGLPPGKSLPRRWSAVGSVLPRRHPHRAAARTGIDPTRLAATVERFNGFARAGRDEDFHRGDSVYDRYYGDPTLPNPNLTSSGKAPFYAIPVHPGDIGTKGGLLTDANARVLREGGDPIPASTPPGNVSAAVMGETYPGPARPSGRP